MKEPVRPLALEIDDAERELAISIEQIANRHGLPCYLMEPLVANILSRLQNGKRIEIENAKKKYEEELAERRKPDVEQCGDNG